MGNFSKSGLGVIGTGPTPVSILLGTVVTNVSGLAPAAIVSVGTLTFMLAGGDSTVALLIGIPFVAVSHLPGSGVHDARPLPLLSNFRELTLPNLLSVGGLETLVSPIV